MAFGQRVMLTSTPDDDMKYNIDYVIGELTVAYRRRRISVKKYEQISIRNRRFSGAKTEAQKILAGECRALLYVFEFLDAWVICKVSDLAELLKGRGGEIVQNQDNTTEAVYLNIKDLPHLFIAKADASRLP